MSRTNQPRPIDEGESIHRDYILGIRILDIAEEGSSVYWFESPDHVGMDFETVESAELYADVYFDVNGFEEAGTGDRGVPPEVIQAGRDTLAAYFLTQPNVDVNWVASFYGKKPTEIERYVGSVRKRAIEIREELGQLGIE
jgi:hypothetical protein